MAPNLFPSLRASVLALPLVLGVSSASLAQNVSNATGFILEPGTSVASAHVLKGKAYRLTLESVIPGVGCSATMAEMPYSLADNLSTKAPETPTDSQSLTVPPNKFATLTADGSPIFQVACDPRGELVVDVLPEVGLQPPESPKAPSRHIPYNILDQEPLGARPRVVSI